MKTGLRIAVPMAALLVLATGASGQVVLVDGIEVVDGPGVLFTREYAQLVWELGVDQVATENSCCAECEDGDCCIACATATRPSCRCTGWWDTEPECKCT